MSKEYQLTRKDLTKHIETLKQDLLRVQKEKAKILEDIPRYSEVTGILKSKISHKKTKSFENGRDFVATKQNTKQLEEQSGRLKL